MGSVIKALRAPPLDRMSHLTYTAIAHFTKPLVWLHGEVKTPPLSKAARLNAGFLLRQLQLGMSLTMPHARPMPAIGPRCLELRIPDNPNTWRILLRLDSDAILILEVFSKNTQATPKTIIKTCKQQAARYDSLDD